MPRTEPTERSTFRVTITIVSPIASRPMIAAPATICCRLVALTKIRVVDRGRADDDHQGEHDPELAEAEEELRDGVMRPRSPSDGKRPLERDAHAAVSARPVAARMIEPSSASARANSRIDPPLEEDDDPVGHPEHLRQLRRDHQHGDAFGARLGEQTVHLGLRADVDTRGSARRRSAASACERATWRGRPSAGCRPRASRRGSSTCCTSAAAEPPSPSRSSVRHRAG